MENPELHLIHTYNRSVTFVRGEDVYLIDDSGKRYLDFGAGIAVSGLGYSNTRFKEGLKEQIDELIHVSNLYYNRPAVQASRYISEASGMSRVFFTNSGTEAIEGAIKLARKYAYLKNQKSGGEIIAMNHSFHGRSMGALSVTGTESYRAPFEPLIGGVSFAEYNDLESVERLITPDTCGILLETVQGEGGIYPASEEFLKGVRELCDRHDIAMILDEIQCGMGRTGSMFAWQKYGVKPDIMTTAKALGCGVPVGAFLLTEKVGANSLKAGDHGTTYGGNPLACAAVCKVLDLFEKNHIIENVRNVSAYLEKKLDGLVEKYDCIQTRRGSGLMQGLVFDVPVAPVIEKALANGLILINAGTHIIRFVPPLVIGRQDVDEMISILERCLL